MDALAPLLILLVLVAVVLIVSAPLRGGTHASSERDAARRADLEAAKRAKYHEIRDTEMDFRTGKLSEADWRAMDRDLRVEALEILRAIDALGPSEDAPG